MGSNYIENLHALAGAGINVVSLQNLKVLRLKYHLSDEEVEKMEQYSKE